MTTLSLVSPSVKKSSKKISKKSVAYNKKQVIADYQKKFKHSFDMKEDAIDLREMSKNFDDGPIPVQEIYEAITTVLGSNYQNLAFNHDPSGGFLGYAAGKRPKVYFDYISWNELYLWTIFQRDVAPNHVEKIYKDFDESSVIVPCVIKITLANNQVVNCVWDGHHTIQVCRLRGYTKFPSWVIDLDQFTVAEIEDAGFNNTDADRIAFGCFIAGKNMRRINGFNKRDLSPYDDFFIGYETKDREFVSIYNILNKHKCPVKRQHNFIPGAFTQIKSGIECYRLKDENGNVGRFWDRALSTHRKYWPGSPLILEIFRPLTYLYERAELEGFVLTPAFDKELASMLIAKWGDADSIQESIKDSYWKAVNNGKLRGDQPQHDKFRVLAGIINFYTQNGGKELLPAPDCQWRI